MNKILSWPSIKSEDAKALKAFDVFTRMCCNAMKEICTPYNLNSSENMLNVMKKLPYKREVVYCSFFWHTRKVSALSSVCWYCNKRNSYNRVCLYCTNCGHTLKSCILLDRKDHSEKINFLKTNVYFGCLSNGHISRDCRKGLSCITCGLLHPIMLHIHQKEN